MEATQNDNKIEIRIVEFDDDSGRAKNENSQKSRNFKESSAYVVLQSKTISKTIDIRLFGKLTTALLHHAENGGPTEFGALSGVRGARPTRSIYERYTRAREEIQRMELPLVGPCDSRCIRKLRVQHDKAGRLGKKHSNLWLEWL